MAFSTKTQARLRVASGSICALACCIFVGASVATGAFSLYPYAQNNGEGGASASAEVSATGSSSDATVKSSETATDGASGEEPTADGSDVSEAEGAAQAIDGAAAGNVSAGAEAASGDPASTSTTDGATSASASTQSGVSDAVGSGANAGNGAGTDASTGSTGESTPDSNSAAAASPSANESATQSSGAAQAIQVSVVIDASAAVSAKPDAGYGGISRTATVSLPQGATARDALVATGANVSGSKTYITGIDGLFEKACSSGSGWMYSVNGSTPMKPASAYVLSAGDVVRWYYVV